MKFPVFYRPTQSVNSNNSYSPSAGKPAKVVRDWKKHFADEIQIRSFGPATKDELALAHSYDYVDDVLSCVEPNGFGNRNPDVAKSLRYTVGSMLHASYHVMKGESPVACSPTSGFHHACYNMGGGYCTFNGLMVTAIAMKLNGHADRILILDFDNHHGNGTEDIIAQRDIKYVMNVTNGKQYCNSNEALTLLYNLHNTFFKDFKPDLVLYQAGADIHIDDPLGGMMTTQDMLLRDLFVFTRCRNAGIPLVWNLAGGYQRDKRGSIEPVLKLHRQTMEACIGVYSDIGCI